MPACIALACQAVCRLRPPIHGPSNDFPAPTKVFSVEAELFVDGLMLVPRW